MEIKYKKSSSLLCLSHTRKIQINYEWTLIHVERLSGGMEKLGIAFSIMVLLQSLTSYFAGHFSDRLGRKPFLFLTAYIDAFILFLYTIIDDR